MEAVRGVLLLSRADALLATFSPNFGRLACEPRHPKPETRNLKPVPRTPIPESRILNPQTLIH